MKKLLIVASLLASVFAAGQVMHSIFAKESVAGTGPLYVPTTATAGIALDVKGVPVKYVNATVRPVPDGGQGHQLTGAVLRAWKYNPADMCAFDGGVGSTCSRDWDGGYVHGWARTPGLDFAWDGGAVLSYAGPVPGGGISFSTGIGYPYGAMNTAPTVSGARLYYTIEALYNADGGTLAIADIYLEGVY